MTKIQIGDMLPDFKSVTHEGTEFSLDNLKGSPTVLYFYPKDNTSGCTLEAKSLRDGKEELLRRGYKIVGVSPDSVKSHQGFCQKHDLNFTLLADTDHSLSEAVGVWQLKKMCGREYMGIVRTTFLLDADARVTHIIAKVDTKDSYGQIIKLLDK
ncbi:MAG: thioredoxin-dependent thiol peroxidase [Alistipes sp.]|nr:thioredoxin-dependent thiol peroxidase [Alistipes sp.]MBR5585498.1 thioredoxin-dependent thiol peroxidase [Alistipes sp.]MBR6544098.1 thioredoxin-dependent thiol peroxidase [Alistipes sp.]